MFPPPPIKVKGLRAFIVAYNVLARVMPQCASVITSLDMAVAGNQSCDTITWSDELSSSFHKAQDALKSTKTITLPRTADQLWIVTDGSVKNHALGATLYVTCNNTPPLFAGFFSAKLKGRQVTWLPCEIEALAIAVATKHFSPYIIQSQHKACILTDSKPCVQAYEKLCRGEFSASPRVATFLSVVSRYQASIRHLAGSANIPSDFASRNAPQCDEPTCQICTFVDRTEDSVVLRVSTEDIMSGATKLPFSSRASWFAIQAECQALRRAHAHLIQGTRPSKKLTNIQDVKRYLNVATIASDGLLVVKRNEPLAPARECIIIPRPVLPGLLTALHIQLDHPSCHQLKLMTRRYFYALDMDKSVDQVSSSCHHCASLRKIPTTMVEHSTEDPPNSVSIAFAADIMKRNRQCILIVRESITSFTAATIIDNERRETIRDALVQLCLQLRPLDGPSAVIRTDSAPGFASLVNDALLTKYRLRIETGRIKNPNKNPVAERAIQEVEEELLHQDPSVTPMVLSVVTARLNSRIRARGLSAQEMYTQQDQFTNNQLPVSDQRLIRDQYHQRSVNHPYSARAKAPKEKSPVSPSIEPGDLVYIHIDRNKSRARDRYLDTSVDTT